MPVASYNLSPGCGNFCGATLLEPQVHGLSFCTIQRRMSNQYLIAVFSTYGTFWMSYAMILIPATGILSSYSDPQEFANAMGIYLITWFAVTILFMCVSFLFQWPQSSCIDFILSSSLPTIRRNLSFTILLSVLSIAFLCLALGEFTGKASYVNFLIPELKLST